MSKPARASKPVTVFKRRALNISALKSALYDLGIELSLRGVAHDDVDIGMTLRLQATSDGHYHLNITQRSQK